MNKKKALLLAAQASSTIFNDENKPQCGCGRIATFYTWGQSKKVQSGLKYRFLICRWCMKRMLKKFPNIVFHPLDRVELQDRPKFFTYDEIMNIK